jgi:hypothetical protein
MRRFLMLSVVTLGVVFALSYAVPAIGGPHAISSASPLSLAKKALKTAKKSDKRSRRISGAINRNGGFVAANVQTVSSGTIQIAQGTISEGSVSCPSGTLVVSGGYSLIGTQASAQSDRRSGNGWAVQVDNIEGLVPAQLVVDAQCAKVEKP